MNTQDKHAFDREIGALESGSAVLLTRDEALLTILALQRSIGAEDKAESESEYDATECFLRLSQEARALDALCGEMLNVPVPPNPLFEENRRRNAESNARTWAAHTGARPADRSVPVETEE